MTNAHPTADAHDPPATYDGRGRLQSRRHRAGRRQRTLVGIPSIAATRERSPGNAHDTGRRVRATGSNRRRTASLRGSTQPQCSARRRRTIRYHNRFARYASPRRRPAAPESLRVELTEKRQRPRSLAASVWRSHVNGPRCSRARGDGATTCKGRSAGFRSNGRSHRRLGGAGFLWGFRVPQPARRGWDRPGEGFSSGSVSDRRRLSMSTDGRPILSREWRVLLLATATMTSPLPSPRVWLVAATGELQNPREVLTDSALLRLERARTIPRVHIVWRRDAERTRTDADCLLEWRTSRACARLRIWCVQPMAVGRHAGDRRRRERRGRPDTAAIHTFLSSDCGQWELRRDSPALDRVLSRDIWPYPYPHLRRSRRLSTDGIPDAPRRLRRCLIRKSCTP